MHTIIENIQEVLLQFLGNLEFPTVCATLQLLSQQTTTIENCGCVFIPLCPGDSWVLLWDKWAKFQKYN